MLPEANVDVRIESDGSLLVEETITFFFEGSFSGAFRDIPLREGESISGIFVAEDGQRYDPGASAELGSFGLPGRYGVADIEGGARVVWHFRAQDEVRDFTIGYRLSGLALAYDDVVDVNLKVWGDEWEQRLGQLTATMTLPGPASGPSYRVFGHPVHVRGDVAREPDRAVLRALDVPDKQFVELRVLFRGSCSARRPACRFGAAPRSIASSRRKGRTRPITSVTVSASTACSTTCR